MSDCPHLPLGSAKTLDSLIDSSPGVIVGFDDNTHTRVLGSVTCEGNCHIEIPNTIDGLHMIYRKLNRVEDTASSMTQRLEDQLDVINVSLFDMVESSRHGEGIDSELLKTILLRLEQINESINSLPEWIPANLLRDSTGLSADAIRKQLQNPALFEPEIDCKQVGRLWYIHRSSIGKIRRKK